MVLYQAAGSGRTPPTKKRASPFCKSLNDGRGKTEVRVSAGICGPEKSHTTQKAAGQRNLGRSPRKRQSRAKKHTK